jgi:replicative DNA helicase
MNDIEHINQFSKQPPSCTEVEREVLGAILLDNRSINVAIENLQPEYFFDVKNKIIFSTMLDLYNRNESIDTITVYNELQKKNEIEGIGGVGYLSKLSQDITSASNVEYHSRIIVEKWLYRTVISESIGMADKSFKGEIDVFDLIDEMLTKFINITSNLFKRKILAFTKVLENMIDAIEKGMSGVKTGFIDIDEKLGMLRKTDLIILAARPAMGKTSLSLNIAKNIAEKEPVLYFSMEMASEQLASRLIASDTGVSDSQMYASKTVPKFSKNLINLKLFIDDSSALHVNEIRSKVQQMKREKDIKLVVVDYIQLAVAKGSTREQEISNISRSLKAIAKDFDIPVLALSQLNRACELRSDKRPLLADLRESGSIEQDADVVMFIFRPSVYDIRTSPSGEKYDENFAEIIISKNRKGAIGSIGLSFDKERTLFKNRALSITEEQFNYYQRPDIFA